MANKLDISIGVIDNASSKLKSVSNAVDTVTKKTERATLGTNQYGEAVGKTTRGLSKFTKSGLQQTGYQVGDFAVQVAGGTSAIQAFGQQGSQLLGIFGPVGAILGAAVAIVSAIALAFEKSSGAAINFNDAISDVTETTNELINATDMVSQKLARMRLDLAFASIQKATQGVSDEVKELTDGVGFLERSVKFLTGGFYTLEGEALNKMRATLGLTQKQTKSLIEVFKKLSSGSLDTKEALDVANDGIEILNQSTKQGTKDFVEYLGRLVSVRDAANDVADAIKNAGTGAKGGVDDTNKALEEQVHIFDAALSPAMNNFFMDIFKGTKSASDAFRSMANMIISELFRILVVEQLVQSIGGAIKASFSPKGVSPKKAAMGGSATSGKPYLVGEKGAELFIPHTAGQIVPNNKMGGSGVTVNQTINISTGVQQTVRAEIAQLMPQIADASKSAVLDARRRGGNFASAFGS